MRVAKVWVRPKENAGGLIADAKALLSTSRGDVMIWRICVFRGPSGLFVRLPRQSFPKDDKTEYREIIRLPSEVFVELESRILKELDR